MDYLEFLKIINNGYDPILLLGKGGLGYRPNRNIYGGTLKKTGTPGFYEIIDDEGPDYEEPASEDFNDFVSDYQAGGSEPYNPKDYEEYLIDKPTVEVIPEDEDFDEEEFQKFLKDIKTEKDPYKKFKEDTLYKELMEKDELDEIDNEEWDELKDENEEIAELDELLQFDSLENNIHEIKTNVIGASGDTDFEDKLAEDENAYTILENLVDGFDRNNVAEIKVMNTGPRGEDIEFDGVKYPCPKDENYPIDLVAYVKTKSGDVEKYAIEAKYYNGLQFDTKEGKKNFTYKEICKKRMEDFDNYKKETLMEIGQLEEELDTQKLQPKPDKKYIKELTTELEKLKEITSTKEKFTESFDRNIYGYFIPMKFTKGGYRFETEIEPDKLGYHKPEFYSEHMKKFKVGQPVIFFNKDGSIKGVKKTLAEYIKDKNGKPIGVKDTGFVEDRYGNKRSLEGFTEHLPQYDILKDCKVLYAISFRDTTVGDNYSKRISQNPELRKNPFYSHHVVKSAYGKSQTESIGLKPQNLKVIKKISVKKRYKS